MHLREYADNRKITLDEAKGETGLSHWKSKVTDEQADFSLGKTDEVTLEKVPLDLEEGKTVIVKPASEIETSVEAVVAPVVEALVKPSDLLKESQVVMKMLMKDGLTPKLALVGIKMIGKKSSYAPYIAVLETLLD